MDIESLRNLALGFTAVTEDIKWTDHLCFLVDDKIFLLISPDEHPIRACFKVSEDDFDKLCAQASGFGQARHFAKRKWIELSDIHLLSKDDWALYLEKSYHAVVAGISKKRQIELGLLP